MLLCLQKNTQKKTELILTDLLAALLLASASFAVCLSQLRLSWGPATAFAGSPFSGLLAAWNAVADTLGNTEYILLSKYESVASSYGFFLTLTAVLLLAFAFLAIKSRIWPLLLLFVLPPAALALLCRLYPKSYYVLFLVVAFLFALACCKQKGSPLHKLPICLLVGILTFVLLTAFGKDGIIFTDSSEPMTAIGKEAADLLYGKDDLGHGDLSKRKRSVREGTALEVAMERPQAMYLKGFVGSSFNGNQWSDLSNTAYYRNVDLMNALQDEAFYAPGQLQQAAAFLSEDMTENAISVKNVGADTRLVFVPYDLTHEGSLSDLSKKGGSLFAPHRLHSNKNYVYTASDNQVEKWTDIAAGFFTKALGSEQNADEIGDYLRAESHYNTFIYENYTQIAAADRVTLLSNIGDAGDQTEGHLDYKQAIDTIRGYLHSNFIYSENLGAPSSESGNCLQEFFASHKGYDVHFATAATLMFRYYGIPARYVEGYLLTPEDAQGKGVHEKIEIPRSNVHAWTEIYIDGIGFVPLEVTPEFYGIMPEADMSVGISNETLVRDYQSTYGHKTQTGLEKENNNDNPNEGGRKVLRILWIVLSVIIGIGLLILLALFIKTVFTAIAKTYQRRRLFYKSEPKTAVSAIYGFIESEGFSLHDDEIALGNRAAYSPQSIAEEERQFMLRILKERKKNKPNR